MGATHPVVATGLSELKMQLEHPTADIVEARALEVFGNPEKAAAWLADPLPVLDGKSPRELVATGAPDQLRRVLHVLIAIDYGMFS